MEEMSTGSLTDRVAIVVGGSGGFGEAIAKRFVADGAKVIISARNAEKLEEVAKSIGAAGAIACDVTSFEQVKALADQVVSEYGRLDIACNASGYEDFCPVAALEPERVEKMVAVQFTGALYFIQHMANAMTAGGSISTIGSLTATLTAEGYAPYAGAKAGINHATRIAASEYGAQGVRINVVSATLVETPMTEGIVNAPGVRAAFTAETPLGRFGTIDDIVNTVSWISSDDAGFITGQNIHVDGGTSLRRLPRAEDFMRAAKDAMNQ
jgi:NAD(P)-dependent dehydrogenase (short-subunit alcohol dehydrogenase family)